MITSLTKTRGGVVYRLDDTGDFLYLPNFLARETKLATLTPMKYFLDRLFQEGRGLYGHTEDTYFRNGYFFIDGEPVPIPPFAKRSSIPNMKLFFDQVVLFGRRSKKKI